MLFEMPQVTELNLVPDAHIPVMKFKFSGVSIDLLYAQLALLVIPEDLDILQDSVLQGVDEQMLGLLDRRSGILEEIKWTGLPIITPAYPSMNSSYNVSPSTKRILLDITAENDDDFRAWNGWVESRIRQLMLKIERHICGKLQCHPHPGDFSDKSRNFLPADDGWRYFDIRRTIEEFKQADVNCYTFRKHGMEIRVSHVNRRSIPNFVFPGGVRPLRPSKVIWGRRQDGGQKRERVDNNIKIDSRHAKSLRRFGEEFCEAGSCISSNVSSCSIICDGSDETEAWSRCNLPIDSLAAVASISNSEVAEELALVKKIMATEEGASVGTPMNSSDGEASSNDSCDGGVEELVDEFMAPSLKGTPLPPVAQSKP
ncbi:unnamed protein product [Malus baccata var. baccata]